MMIYQYDSNGYATGHTTQRQEGEPISPGWTHKAPKGVEGERFIGNVWQAVPLPAPAVPKSVTMRQARLALLQSELLHLVDAAIDSLDEPGRSAARIEWEYSQVVERDRQFVQMLAAELGLTEEQVDDLFILAGTL